MFTLPMALVRRKAAEPHLEDGGIYRKRWWAWWHSSLQQPGVGGQLSNPVQSNVKSVHPWRVEFSEPTVQLTRPIEATEVADRATAAAALVTQIEKSMQASHSGAQPSSETPASVYVWRN